MTSASHGFPREELPTVGFRLNVPDSVRATVRHAIRDLVEPLSVRPVWISDTGGAAGSFYYGPPDGCDPAEHPLAFDASAQSVLSARQRLEPGGIRWRRWQNEDWPVLFADEQGDPDLVAGAAYLLCGMDETGSQPRDSAGRIRFDESLPSKAGFAEMPAVDAYREWLAEELLRHGLPVRRRLWAGRSWAVCPTFDVDYLWKWRKGMVYREVVRNLLLNDRGERTKDRFRRFWSFLGDASSPGDAYRSSLGRMVDEVRARGGTATVFLKAGAHGPNDVAYSLRRRWIQRLIARARNGGFEFGLHPSYYADSHGGYLREEVDRLTAATGARPVSVRQHYLRYQVPTTLDLHREAGFKIDATLGYATGEGFRRGTCMPFRIYDLHRDASTEMWEMPLIAMDGALFNRQGYSVDEATQVTVRLLNRCRAFGGCAVLLWHNVLWDEMDAPGWGEHFLRTLDYAVAAGALLSSLEGALAHWRRGRHADLPSKGA